MLKPVAPKEKPIKTKAAALLRTYYRLHEKLGRPPTSHELDDAGFSRDTVRHNVGNMRRLDAMARAEFPDKFYDVDLTREFINGKQGELAAVLNSYRRFVVTTNVLGCPVDTKYLEAIRTYCRVNDAALLVLVASDPAKRNTPGGYGSLDKALVNENIVLSDVNLNESLRISTIKMSAKQADPIVSMERIGGRHQSCIFASPKQRLKLVPTSSKHLPLALMTTGSINRPDYTTDRYLAERTAAIATSDHVTGALIIEIDSAKMFHYRQTQAGKDGSFIDLGVEYSKAGTKPIAAAALITGDWHAGSVAPQVRNALPEMCDVLRPKRIVTHDALDSRSVNHHELDQVILRARRAEAGQLNLEDEFKELSRDLAWMTTLADEVVVVASNHIDMVPKMLESGRFIKDPTNLRLSLQLALAMLDGADPLVAGIELVSGKTAPFLKKIKFLERDEDFIVAGIHLGAHGDMAGNGAKGSVSGLEKAYGSSVTGHSHSPSITRQTWVVGTSSLLRLEYTRGPSSWVNCHCVVYPNGTRQLINIISGKWRL